MKKLLLSCLTIVAIATSIKAQNPQVQVSATAKTYRVNNPVGYVDNYVWSLNAAGMTAAPTFTNSGTATQSITWTVPQNNVTLTLTPSSNASHGSCLGNVRSITIDVVSTLTYAVEVQTAPANVCSGDVPSATFRLNGYTSGTWSFTYTIDGGTTTYTTSTHNAASGFIPTIDSAAGIVNTGSSLASHNLNIISWRVGTTDYYPASPVNVAYSTYAVPSVDQITLVP